MPTEVILSFVNVYMTVFPPSTRSQTLVCLCFKCRDTPKVFSNHQTQETHDIYVIVESCKIYSPRHLRLIIFFPPKKMQSFLVLFWHFPKNVISDIASSSFLSCCFFSYGIIVVLASIKTKFLLRLMRQIPL